MFFSAPLAIEPLGVDGFGTPAADPLACTGVDDGVLLFEVLASGGAVSDPYAPSVFGTFPLGTLPYAMRTVGAVPFYFADRSWTARPDDADTPNRYYEGRAAPLQIQQGTPLPPGSGRPGLTVGQLTVDNTDGQFDTVTRSLGVDLRPIIIKRLPSRAARYADAVPLFTGVCQGWLAAGNQLRFTLRDNGWLLSQQLLELYTGTGGADGTTAIAGQPVLQVYGKCRNVAPQLVDPALLIYRVHDRLIQAVDAVRVRGATVSSGGAQASYAALAGASLAGGTYQVALTASGSFIRLGSSPDGVVTCDVRGDAVGGYVADTAGILRRILERRLPSSQLALDSFVSLAARLPGTIGVLFNETISVQEAVQRVLTASYCYLVDLPDGRMAVGQIGLPGAGGMSVNASHILNDPSRLELPDTVAPCLWRIAVGYRKNWTVMGDADLVPAPTITEALRQEYKQNYRLDGTGLNDSARLARHPGAIDMVVESLFDDQTDAAALAAQIFAMFAPGRELWSIPLANTGHRVGINAAINLVWPRGGLQEGRDLRVVGRTYDGRGVTLLAFG